MNKQTLIAVIITAIVVGTGTYYFQSNFSIEKKTEIEAVEEKTVAIKIDEPDEEIVQKTYSNDLFSVDYPSSYSLEIDERDKFDVITIANENGSIKITDNSIIFFVGGPAAPSDPEWELPKDEVHHGWDGVVTSALFYKAGDDVSMKELKEIQNSIVLK